MIQSNASFCKTRYTITLGESFVLNPCSLCYTSATRSKNTKYQNAEQTSIYRAPHLSCRGIVLIVRDLATCFSLCPLTPKIPLRPNSDGCAKIAGGLLNFDRVFRC